jgi:hypothetical protein
MVYNLALFCFATVWATFQKIGQFFPNHLVTLVMSFTQRYLILEVEQWQIISNSSLSSAHYKKQKKVYCLGTYWVNV